MYRYNLFIYLVVAVAEVSAISVSVSVRSVSVSDGGGGVGQRSGVTAMGEGGGVGGDGVSGSGVRGVSEGRGVSVGDRGGVRGVSDDGSGVSYDGSGVGDHGSVDKSRVLAHDGVEAAVGVGGVVNGALCAVGVEERVLADHAVADAGLVLALDVSGVGVRHAVGEAGVVVATVETAGLSGRHQHSDNDEL